MQAALFAVAGIITNHHAEQLPGIGCLFLQCS
jgi:hypothetical protein